MTSSETVVKDRSMNCLMFECPNFVAQCDTTEDGTPYFEEGDKAYVTGIYCSNQVVLGIGNGACLEAQKPEEREQQNGVTDA